MQVLSKYNHLFLALSISFWLHLLLFAYQMKPLPSAVLLGTLAVALERPLYPDPRATALMEQTKAGLGRKPETVINDTAEYQQPAENLSLGAVTQTPSDINQHAPMNADDTKVVLDVNIPPEPKHDPELPPDFGGLNLRVRMELVVSAEGKVIEARMAESNGSDAENKFLLSVWSEVPFWPGVKNGKPVTALAQILLSKKPMFQN